MCDVQLLTGVGILLSGYIGLSCYISAYHWQLVVYLAWFSNLTHISCLTAMRSYLNQHRSERNWRLFVMTALWAGLIPAMVPTAFFNWHAREPTASLPWSNARCFFDLSVGHALFNETACFAGDIDNTRTNTSNPNPLLCETMSMDQTSALQSAIVSILLLAFSYASRVIKITKGLSDTVRVGIRNKISGHYTKRLAQRINKLAASPGRSAAARRAQNLIHIKARIALYLVAQLYVELLTSDASDVSLYSCPSLDTSRATPDTIAIREQVYWLFVSAIWGTLRLTEAKDSAAVDEYDWGFGQILPVFLLIGPIVTAIEAVMPEDELEEERNPPHLYATEAGDCVAPSDSDSACKHQISRHNSPANTRR